MNITREDIQQLVREPSAAMRSRIAEKICVSYNSGQLTDAEARLANEIFRLLLKDTEAKVRRVLSDQLKSNMQVPHDIVWTLANDKAEVSVPVLQHSYVLSEDDLVAIVKATKEVAKLRAVAMRDSVSRPLSRALIEKEEPEVARLVVANKSAALSEEEVDHILAHYVAEPQLLEELVYRGGLSHAVAERLFYKVSGSMKRQLTKKYRLSKEVVDDTVDAARETAVLEFLSPWMSQQDMTHLVHEMEKSKRLTDSVIIRSLVIGDVRFFVTAIAKRVGVPVSNAKILITDPGPLGFKTLYANAKLPPDYYECVRVLLKLAQEETQFGDIQTHDFSNRMLARIVAGGYDKTVQNMDTLVVLLKTSLQDKRILH